METKQSSDYPVTFDVQYSENYSRLWALATLLLFIPKGIALIPHLLILYVLQFVLVVVFILAQITVLITGKQPKPFF